MATTKFEMGRLSGYGQYFIRKITPTGRKEKRRTNDSQLFDDYTENKASQARMKRVFDSL